MKRREECNAKTQCKNVMQKWNAFEKRGFKSRMSEEDEKTKKEKRMKRSSKKKKKNNNKKDREKKKNKKEKWKRRWRSEEDGSYA